MPAANHVVPSVAPPSRRWPAWLPVALLVLAGLVVFLPAVRAPRYLDDYFQTSMIEGTFPSPRKAWDLYNLCGDADRPLLIDRGLLPWWSHPRLAVRFLRPLSSVLLFANHRIFGNRPLLFHLHSFAWWVAAVLAARALFRRTLGSRAAWMATVAFALAPCHVTPLIRIANREALVSVTFGILAMTALVRFREEGRLLHAATAVVLFGAALLGGEYALCFAGYVLALALVDRRRTWGARAVAVLSFAAPAAAYLAVRARLGYGAVASGFYHDPLHDPVEFLRHVPRRLATLLAQGWLTLDAETVDVTTSPWVLGIVVVLGSALLLVPVLRSRSHLDDQGRTHARWLLLGSLLSLTPVLAVMPSPRLLGASCLGLSATVALILNRAWFPPAPDTASAARELTGLVAVVLGFFHLVHGPATSWITAANTRKEALGMVDRAEALMARSADPTSAEFVMVRGLGDAFVLPYTLDPKGAPPARWRLLALTGHVLVLRKDARTIEIVAPRNKSLFPTGEGNQFRGDGAPFAPGNVVRVPGMRVTILESGDAGPHRVRFEFDDALESPGRVWVNDRFDGIEDGQPPEPGFGKPFDPWPPPKKTPTPPPAAR